MIQWIEGGDIFESGCDIIVNPVDIRGIMGKGLALEMKTRFPEICNNYTRMCKDLRGLITGGYTFYCYTGLEFPKYIIHLATKKSVWKDSKIEYIERGLTNLRRLLADGVLGGCAGIAIPALGCGLGGLEWERVKPLISKYLGNIHMEIKVYAPR